MKQYQERKESPSNNITYPIYRYIFLSFTFMCMIACQLKSVENGEKSSRISSEDVYNTNDSILRQSLIQEIEHDNLAYLADTIWGECLVFKYELEFKDKNGYLNYPSFLTKKQIEADISTYHNFLAEKSSGGNSVKEMLLKKIKTVEIHENREFVVSVPVGDGEFDSSCLFHFSIVGKRIYLRSIMGN